MKRLISYAVENGFDKVAWINGNQQNGGQTGGDGAWFYERNLVNETNAILKKLGARVEKINMGRPGLEGRAALEAERDDIKEQKRQITEANDPKLDAVSGIGFGESEAILQQGIEIHALDALCSNDLLREGVDPDHDGIQLAQAGHRAALGGVRRG